MSSSNRRDFMKKSVMTVGAMVAAPVVKSGFAQNKPSNVILEPADQAIEFEYRNKQIHLTVPKLEIHSAIVVK